MRVLAASVVAVSILMTGCATSFQKSVDPQVLAKQQNLLQQAEAAHEKHDSAEAIKYLEQASAEGSGKASYKLGEIFIQGQNGQQDKKKAFQYFSKADEQGNVDGTINAAWFTMYGIGTDKNEDQGVDLMEKAAKVDPRAQREVGLFNANLRHPFLNSDRQGFKYLQKATDGGDGEAPYYLSVLAKRTEKADIYSKALKVAADRGQPKALLELGRQALANNQFMIARDLFEKSAFANDSEAMFEMGKGIHAGVFPPTINSAAKNVEAYAWLNGAASMRHLQAIDLQKEIAKETALTPEISKQIQDVGLQLQKQINPWNPNKN
ncbi:tetratricopeptide repeat protein [Pseudomonas syringae pv. actinidiae]|nr:tetratricopeptide repeat protein [Pseudomonas syringae pv. actinidiae]